jgi:hypothetical protein
MMETQESSRTHHQSERGDYVKGPPRKYEKIIQKLESDVRGHIRLEHEMKIHMDYLENKVENFSSLQAEWEREQAKLMR